eukprot:7154128-Alexandrium_andersonii.AAC.1
MLASDPGEHALGRPALAHGASRPEVRGQRAAFTWMIAVPPPACSHAILKAPQWGDKLSLIHI